MCFTCFCASARAGVSWGTVLGAIWEHFENIWNMLEKLEPFEFVVKLG